MLLHTLSSSSLGVQDKIRCEHVCRSWRELLRCSRPSSCRNIWGSRLWIDVGNQKEAGLVTYAHPFAPMDSIVSITLSPETQSANQDACIKWILQRHFGVPSIRVSFNSKDLGGQTAKLLHALHHSSSSRPSGLEFDLTDICQSGFENLSSSPRLCFLCLGY